MSHAPTDVPGCVYVNGAYTPPGAATISVADHGFLYGDGVFETLRTFGGAPFRLRAHLARLARALEAVEIHGAPTADALAGVVSEALARAGLDEAYVRITVTRGIGTRGPDPAHCGPPTVVVAALPLRTHPASHYETGIHVGLLWRRAADPRPPVTVKSTNYQAAILARAELGRRGQAEGLYLDAEGNLAEGTFTNVFVVRDAKLLTPPPTVCLPGITRDEVIDVARELGLEVHQTSIAPAAAAAASEMFVTSSLAGLLPVTSLEGHPVGTGRPGPVYARLVAGYEQRTRRGA